jgi:TPR repeat protein
VNRTARAEDLPQLGAPVPAEQFAPMPGSVLFASAVESKSASTPDAEKESDDSGETSAVAISLPRSLLVILVCVAAAIFLVLGYTLAPFIQTRLQQRGRSMPTVLASSPSPKPENASSDSPPALAVETASFAQLQQMAEEGDPAAENALGLRYFQGDEKNHIVRDEQQAFRWFRSAADHGSLPAQAKLGALYWGGRGVTKDVNQAYFWTVLARARGDKENKDLASILSSGMTRSHAAVIEQQADTWLQQHLLTWKPTAGR